MPRINVKDKRKQQLMEANIASIARRGLAETTISHVSKGADMSRGIVNFYFTSKEKMMQETLAFLSEEYTSAWQDALAAKRKQTQEPLALIETIMQTLLGDRLCNAKRLSVWAAFIGHAGTHAAYGRMICAMDELLVKQLRELWQKAGLEAKESDERARQMAALIRGHWLLAAIGGDGKRPSAYSAAWLALLHGATAPASAKVTPLHPAPAKPKKPAPAALPGQLDFGDLFSQS